MNPIQQRLLAGWSDIPTDGNYPAVVALLHFNGINGASSFADNSRYAKTATRSSGNAAIVNPDATAFGGASLRGTNSTGITVPMGTEISGRNWTAECWVKRDPTYPYFGLFYFNPNLVLILCGLFDDTHPMGCPSLVLGGAHFLTDTVGLAAGAWAHIAVTCQQGIATNNTFRLFVNGILVASHDTTSVNVNLDPSVNVEIGRHDSTGFYGIYGYLDEWRLTMACRYTANFAVQTAPFPDC